MKSYIYCKPTSQGTHSFYLVVDGIEYFLFCQSYRKGVHHYFSKGVSIARSLDYSRGSGDTAVLKTMEKMKMYIKYVEKENGIKVLEKTKKKESRNHIRYIKCA